MLGLLCSIIPSLGIWETLNDCLGIAASFTNYPEEGETNPDACWSLQNISRGIVAAH